MPSGSDIIGPNDQIIPCFFFKFENLKKNFITYLYLYILLHVNSFFIKIKTSFIMHNFSALYIKCVSKFVSLKISTI